MIGNRHLPSQIEVLNYEENLSKHYKKLEEIQREDRKKRNVDKEVVEKTKFTESREKTIKFHISEKTNAIEKDNELLLGRLVEISRKKPGVLTQVKSENNLPRTLNGPSRRREKNRIAAENEAFARRLLSQQPSFNPKRLELDYEKHHQRVKNMAKISYFSPRKVRLPPIKYADFDNTKDNKRSVKNANKKDQKKKNNDKDRANGVSPIKTEGNATTHDNQTTTTDNNLVKDKVDQETLNIQAQQQNRVPSAVAIDNRSQTLEDKQQQNSANNEDKKIDTKDSNNNDTINQNKNETKTLDQKTNNDDQVDEQVDEQVDDKVDDQADKADN